MSDEPTLNERTLMLMRRRNITVAEVRDVLAAPDVVYEVEGGQRVYRRGALDVIVGDGEVWSAFRHPPGTR